MTNHVHSPIFTLFIPSWQRKRKEKMEMIITIMMESQCLSVSSSHAHDIPFRGGSSSFLLQRVHYYSGACFHLTISRLPFDSFFTVKAEQDHLSSFTFISRVKTTNPLITIHALMMNERCIHVSHQYCFISHWRRWQTKPMEATTSKIKMEEQHDKLRSDEVTTERDE